MHDKFKGLIAGLLLGTMVTGGTVFAASKVKIEVNYENLTYMVDGVEKKPSMGRGFIYNGTTYVPLRFAGEALGKEVDWDEKTKTIWIGKKDGESKYLTNVEYARMDIDGANTIEFLSSGNKAVVAGNEYVHGIVATIGYFWGSSVSVDYNLNGDYTVLSGFLGIDDATKNSTSSGKVKIIGDGEELYVSDGLMGGDVPKEINVDVAAVHKLKVVFESDKEGYDNTKIVFGEATLKQ